MSHKLSLISIVLFLFFHYSGVFAQYNRGKSKVIVPTIEYVEDNLKNTPDKESNTINYEIGPILLKNNYEDLFEDYEGKAVIDDKPQYSSENTYILEKVVYTKTEIIFSLAIYFKAGAPLNATFYPRNHHHHWFLKDLSTGKKHSFKSVHLIRKNGILESKKLKDFPLTILANKKTQTIFTCRVHFDRLPNSSKKVHLIEGRGKAKDKNHFNFFNIELKQLFFD